MHLLKLTLSSPTAITGAIYGNFSTPQSQEFIVSHGTTLQLYRPDENGQLKSLLSTPVFGILRCILPFRLTGSNRDYLLIGTDSGKILIYTITPKLQLQLLAKETFGKTGCRRITPGQILAADPKGRAILIAAIEKQKLVYVMNRDAANNLTISSPLEAHRANAIHFDAVGLDVAFENPIFACLELNHAEADSDSSGQAALRAEKILVYYELDLGLNHVTRRWSQVVLRDANRLVSVPGGSEGPGGVLVIGQGTVQYLHEHQAMVQCAFPRRREDNETDSRPLLIVATATHKQRDLFFVLLQSEVGDVYKLSVKTVNNVVTALSIFYFDTLPVSSALCISKTGLLFSASEHSNHYLFQFTSIGEESEEKSENVFDVHDLEHVSLVSTLSSLAPLTQLLVGDFCAENTKQLLALCGQGNRSTLRILRHGLNIVEMACTALPGIANAIFCLKEHTKDPYHKYIIVSFENATLVLQVSDTVEEIVDTLFLRDCASLYVSLLEDDSMLQIHTNGIRHIRANALVTEWKAPGKKVVQHCHANARQVVLSLAGGEVLYFELNIDALSEKGKLDLGFEVTCLHVGSVPENRQRFPFLAIGSWDSTVRILSLDPNDLFAQKSTLALTCHPHTLCFAFLESEHSQELFLSIGLDNGVFQQSKMDLITAQLSESHTRFLGTKPVKLFTVTVQNASAILALSSRPWLSYFYQNRRHIMPLSCEPLFFASSFSSEQCAEGIATVNAQGMKILTLDQLGEMFHPEQCHLRYTPRRMLFHAPSQRLLIAESDAGQVRNETTTPFDMQIIENEEERELTDALLIRKTIRNNTPGIWSSCLRIVDVAACRTIACQEMEPNEHIRCMTTCVFHDRGGEVFIVVGSVKNYLLHPCRAPEGGLLRVYRLVERVQLVLVHTTAVQGVPHAMTEFQNHLAVSIDHVLRIYDIGKRKLLKKCENRNFPSPLIDLKSAGDRIYASDLQQSVHFIRYKAHDNQLIAFADDCVPHFMTCSALVDYDTIAGGDKFGNLFVTRLPSQVSDEMENPTGNRMLWDSGVLNGAPHKLEQISQAYIGEVITSVLKTDLMPGGLEAIIFATIMGRIGALVPLLSREDVDFYTHLEMYMRQELPSVSGRDHLSFCSYFIPVKNVTDGDLCELFASLEMEKQKSIAQDLDRTPAQVMKKLQDIRNQLL